MDPGGDLTLIAIAASTSPPKYSPDGDAELAEHAVLGVLQVLGAPRAQARRACQ